MTRKRFRKLNCAMLVAHRMDTKETGLMRNLYADKIMPDEGISYEEEWVFSCIVHNLCALGIREAEVMRR